MLPQKIQNDFDRITLLEPVNWDHNSHHHNFLLKQLPLCCERILEIGCGAGACSRLLSEHADRVIGIDLSPKMIEIAKQQSSRHLNLDFQVADILKWEFPIEQFDAIVSIATVPSTPPLRQTLSSHESTKLESSSATDESTEKNQAEDSASQTVLSNQQAKEIAFTNDWDDRVISSPGFTSLKGQLVAQFEEENWPRDFIEGGAPMANIVHASELFIQGKSKDLISAEMKEYTQNTTAKFYSVADYYPAFITGAAKDIYLPKYLEMVKRECRDLTKN